MLVCCVCSPGRSCFSNCNLLSFCSTLSNVSSLVWIKLLITLQLLQNGIISTEGAFQSCTKMYQEQGRSFIFLVSCSDFLWNIRGISSQGLQIYKKKKRKKRKRGQCTSKRRWCLCCCFLKIHLAFPLNVGSCRNRGWNFADDSWSEQSDDLTNTTEFHQTLSTCSRRSLTWHLLWL